MLAAAGFPVLLIAQQKGLSAQMAEELLYQNETSVIAEEYIEQMEDKPFLLLDLNQASPEELKASGVFTPFQVHQLIRYRERFGTIYSLYELAALTGFDASTLSVLESRIELSPGPGSPVRKQSKHLVMIDVGRTHPESVAYGEDSTAKENKIYPGSPLHATVRIRSQAGNHLSLGFTYEKDPGETLGYKGMPQFLSGYLQYQGEGIFKQLVAGTFKLNHGMGLVNGTGFYHLPGSLNVNQSSLAQLKPYASKTEQRFDRGLACQLAWSGFRVLLWASHTRRDLSPGSLSGNPAGSSWWEYQRNTGLHRTPDELEGRKLAARSSAGIQLLYHRGEFALGLMTGAERWSLGKQASKILGADYDPVLVQHTSLQGTWQHGRWQVFGELVAGGNSSFACQAGSMVQFNDFLRGTLLVHHYGKDYKGSLPSSYASGSHLENELGVAVHFHLEPGRVMVADVTGEIFKYPSPRYQTLVPSQSFRLALTLQSPLPGSFLWRIRLVSKTRQSTPLDGTTGVRPLKEYLVTRYDFRFAHEAGEHLSWQSRVVLSSLSSSPDPMPAYAALLEAHVQASPGLQGSIQFVVFHVKEWENRIYLHEPGFYYSFSFPGYYGQGQKTSFLLTLKAGKRITLSSKFAVLRYYDRKETGSGSDLVQGNRRWETALQLRLKF